MLTLCVFLLFSPSLSIYVSFLLLSLSLSGPLVLRQPWINWINWLRLLNPDLHSGQMNFFGRWSVVTPWAPPTMAEAWLEPPVRAFFCLPFVVLPLRPSRNRFWRTSRFCKFCCCCCCCCGLIDVNGKLSPPNDGIFVHSSSGASSTSISSISSSIGWASSILFDLLSSGFLLEDEDWELVDCCGWLGLCCDCCCCCCCCCWCWREAKYRSWL